MTMPTDEIRLEALEYAMEWLNALSPHAMKPERINKSLVAARSELRLVLEALRAAEKRNRFHDEMCVAIRKSAPDHCDCGREVLRLALAALRSVR